MLKKYSFIFCVLGLCAVQHVAAQVDASQIMYGEPYLQNPSNDGITVMWQTNVPAYGWVEYGTDTLHMQTVRTVRHGQGVHHTTHNKVRIEHLAGGVTYYYRVCSRETLPENYKYGQVAKSAFHTFTLPAYRESDFTAIFLNDLHRKHATIDSLSTVFDNHPYDFVVFNGDCLGGTTDEAEARDVLDYFCRKVHAADKPMLYVRGNHETRDNYAPFMSDLFDYPDDKAYGAFTWGDTRFVYLDCGEWRPDTAARFDGLNEFAKYRMEEREFLKSEISSMKFLDATRRVLINHIPIFSTPGLYEECWFDVLKNVPFDVHVSAHQHRLQYYPVDSCNHNPTPFVVGGGPTLDNCTVIYLQRKGNNLTLTVYAPDGKELLCQDLPARSEEIHITAPIDTVCPYIDRAKDYLASALEKDVANYADFYMNPGKDVVVAWTNTCNYVSGFTVSYATKPDYSDAINIETDWKTFRQPLRNLYRNTRYYVRVTANNNANPKPFAETTFTTTDKGPRVMSIPNLYNVRDLGGYPTSFGKTTLQGMVYRGSELNDPVRGMLLTQEGNEYMSNVLKIAYEMDLRAASGNENGNITSSPISSASYEVYDLGGYANTFSKEQAEKFRKVFSALAKRENYPMYIHCKVGADRTGTVCFLLNALLGVSMDDLVHDYEFTTFSYSGMRSTHKDNWVKFMDALNKYPGETTAEKVENFLRSIGVTKKEIRNIRSIMFGD